MELKWGFISIVLQTGGSYGAIKKKKGLSSCSRRMWLFNSLFEGRKIGAFCKKIFPGGCALINLA